MKRLLLFLAVVCVASVQASNLRVTNQRIAQVKHIDNGGDANIDTAVITFDIAWDNSWRDSENWDAAWVFVKYYDVSECAWHHCWICPDEGSYFVTNTNGRKVKMTIETSPVGAYNAAARPQRGVGAFLFNAEETTSGMVPGQVNTNVVSNNWQGVRLAWLIGDQGVDITQVQYIKVFAFEMVFVPTAQFHIGDNTTWYSFNMGDGGVKNSTGCGGGLNSARGYSPFVVTGAAINEGMFSSDCTHGSSNCYGAGRCYLNCFTASATDNYASSFVRGVTSANTSTGTYQAYGTPSNSYSVLPITYPLGYKAFYCMKTEVSQQMYCEFLNTLPFGTGDTHSRYPAQFGNNRYSIKRTSSKFMCDINNNEVGDEPNDGQWIACNYMRYTDLEAFADWAGLRPMTELEFEKACRGPRPYMSAVANEYAWGNTTIIAPHKTTSAAANVFNRITEVLADNETPQTPNCMYNGDNAAWAHIGPTVPGQFARTGTGRQAAGATYYGILDMSGNVWELCVSVYMNTSCTHTYKYDDHGDGELASGVTGNAFHVTQSNGQCYGIRGGGWETTRAKSLSISDRVYATEPAQIPKATGFRCVRSAVDHMNY